MQPYFDPTRKTTSKKMEDDLKNKKMEDDLKKNKKKLKFYFQELEWLPQKK
jgi:hypothetical protein